MTEPVFVTGASGFIARNIVLDLLRSGKSVRGSVRSTEKGAHVRESMARHLGHDPGDALEIVELDLMRDDGWAGAMAGCHALIHTASPVPFVQPENEDEVIRPAVEGTRRALGAARAAGIGRVVLTSSVAAVSGEAPTQAVTRYSEADWTDPDLPGIAPYVKSKTLAERAAWDMAKADPGLRLTTINPAFVFGPALDDDFGASLSVVKRVLKGTDPLMPRVSFSIVDVRDVAAAHVRALYLDEMIGQRVCASAGEMWMLEMARALRQDHPALRIARWPAPDWLIRVLAIRDKPLRFVVPSLGKRAVFDQTRFRALLGRDPIPAETALRDAGRFLVENGHI